MNDTGDSMAYPASYSLNQHIRHVLYALKRQYGGAVDVYKLIDSQVNPRTGVKVVTTSVTHVRRAVVLPAHMARKLIRGAAMNLANKSYTSGAAYDANSRDFIIDRRDTRLLLTLTSDDWLVYSGRKYQLVEIEASEFDSMWVVTARELVGEVPEDVSDVCVNVDDDLDLAGDAESV